MKKLFTLIFVSTLLFSCSQDNDAINEENTMDFETRVNNGEFDNSKFGIYKGVFTTLDASYRGTVTIKLDGKNTQVAEIFFPDNSKIQLGASSKFTKSPEGEKIAFSDNDLSFDLVVNENGSDPKAENVTYKGKEGSIFMAKQTSKQAVAARSGTYICVDCSNHPELGKGGIQTFNTLLTGGNEGTIEIQATLNSKVYGEGSALTQSNCTSPNPLTPTVKYCDVDGTFAARSGNVIVTGTHIYNDAAGYDCSTFEDGTFTYDSDLFGISTMEWESDGPTADGAECF
jgi:hypothetical protein